MNGEANGTMEQCTEISLPDSTLNEKEDNSDERSSPHQNDHKNNLGTNDLEDESSHDSVTKSDLETNTDNDQQPDNCNLKCSNEIVQNNGNDESISNHCSNSNESYSESVISSQGKMDEKSNDDSNTSPFDKNTVSDVNNHEETLEINSEGSSEDEGSVLSAAPRAEDTVSINSESEDDDDTSQESKTNKAGSDIIILENDRGENPSGNSNCSINAEIHEISNDIDDNDCVSNDHHWPKQSGNSTGTENRPRRSSRAIKRKNYDDSLENGSDDDFGLISVSDLEEVEVERSSTRITKPIVINDTKALVEMAAKRMRLNQKKEPTVVIIDTNSGEGQPSRTKTVPTVLSTNTQSLYQSMIARGTTVTPVSSKTSSPSNTSNSTPTILPSLTDDMYVVEAPSFIVPYVYEKPSIKAFREFLNILGKELEEQKAKEDQEQLQKEKGEREKKDKLRKERKEKGEEVSASDDETSKDNTKDEAKEEERKKKKAEKREKRRRKNEDDDDSWDGESSSDSEDETLSDDDKIVVKDKADSIEEIKDVTEMTVDKVCSGKSDNYFDCSLGKFFINIGLNLVQEYVQNDLLKQQNRKLSREKKSGHSTKGTQCAIASLKKDLEFSKYHNAPYAFTQKKCDFCSFKTESTLALNHHLETPHMKNNLYKCNFCDYEIKSPHDILSHMESVHKIRGKLERAPAYHQCCNCPFEDNGKGKLARHQIACAKKFKPELNLSPPIEWEPPAKIPKIARSRNNMAGSYQNAFNRQVGNNVVRTPINVANLMPGASGGYKPRGRSPLAGPARGTPVHGVPIVRAGSLARQSTPVSNLYINNYPVVNNGKSKSVHQPSISITPLPRQPQPTASQSKNTFVICEICDGYIKDLEQLRNHMQWIHKVKIHPKMIYNRPPLNCQKCQFRFFTDQGLERHLLGSHGLVTSSMQEAANKGKDAGRCPVCGRVYQWKLLNHVARDHNLTLKPAHLSYKCTVCTATFGMYKQFENHVYSAHSVVAKRVMDKSKTTAVATKPANDSIKPLKINDEITIIPQPAKTQTSTKPK